MTAASLNTRVGVGEMWVLVFPHFSRQRGRCVGKQRAAAGLWGRESRSKDRIWSDGRKREVWSCIYTSC